MKNHLQFCGQYRRTNHKYPKKEETDRGMCGVVCTSFIRKKVSGNSKLYRKNEDIL